MNDTADQLSQIPQRTITWRGSLVLVIALFLAAVLGEVAVGLAAGAYMSLRGEPIILESIPLRLFPLLPIVEGLLEAAVLVVFLRRYPPEALFSRGIGSVGLAHMEGRTVRRAFAGGLGLGMCACVLIVLAFAGKTGADATEPPLAEMIGGASVGRLLVWIAWSTAAAPVLEEVVFRGALFSGFARSFGVSVSGLIVSALFLALHLYQINYQWPFLAALTLLTSALLALRIRTGSIVPGIAMHTGYNLFLNSMMLVGGMFKE